MYSKYLNSKAEKQILKWEKDFQVKIEISKPSKTRLGVFIPKQNGKNIIRINQDLNRYSFLITIVHELAHASIWKKFTRNVNPHGIEWKNEFKSMMLPFLNPDFFPEDILRSLSLHMIHPKASTVRDVELSEILRSYNKSKTITIKDLKDGDYFRVSNGKEFKRIERLRKNYKCKELLSGRLYRFSPLAEIIPL